MLLPQLQADLTGALARVRGSRLDASVVGVFIDDVCTALTNSGILLENVTLVRAGLQEIAKIDTRSSSRSHLLRIETALFNSLCGLFCAEVPIFFPEKGKSSIVLFVGEGAEKTISAILYGNYHRVRGYSVSLVCAWDLTCLEYHNFLNGSKNAGISCYGRLNEKDVVKIACDGVQKYKEDKVDIIMLVADDGNVLVAEAVRPDLTIVTVDASLSSQAAHEVAISFQVNYPFGGVIITNLIEPNAGGLITAITTAKLPLLYVDTASAFDPFESKSFVTQLLGLKNRFIEINTQEFQEILRRCHASQAEEAAMMESFQEAYTEFQLKQLAKYRSLSLEICALEGEFKELCDQLDEEAAKNSEIEGVHSIEERRDCMARSLVVLKYTKDARLLMLVQLKSEARDLCRLLNEKITEEEYRFLSNGQQIEEALVANRLSLSVKTIDLAKKKIKDLETRALPKIFQKMDQLHNLLQKESYMTDHKDFQIFFSKQDVQNGTVCCVTAFKAVEELYDKAYSEMLRTKQLKIQAKLEDPEDATQLDYVACLLKKIQEWELYYASELCYEDESKGEVSFMPMVLRKLKKLQRKQSKVNAAPLSSLEHTVSPSPERSHVDMPSGSSSARPNSKQSKVDAVPSSLDKSIVLYSPLPISSARPNSKQSNVNAVPSSPVERPVSPSLQRSDVDMSPGSSSASPDSASGPSDVDMASGSSGESSNGGTSAGESLSEPDDIAKDPTWTPSSDEEKMLD